MSYQLAFQLIPFLVKFTRVKSFVCLYVDRYRLGNVRDFPFPFPFLLLKDEVQELECEDKAETVNVP